MEGRLHDGAQHGFRPAQQGHGGLPPQHASAGAWSWLGHTNTTPLYAAFVDFRKAFDSVKHEAMWRVLKARGVHLKLLALIKDIYSGSRARIRRLGLSQTG